MHKIKNIDKQLLSDNWYILNKYSFLLKRKDGSYVYQEREVYDRGDGATILLYNMAKKSVVLTKQFRLPTYLNGNQDGMLLETCAGLLEGDSPEYCACREAEEETGFKVQKVQKVFELYMSPGAVTERVHFFIAEYSNKERSSNGGGIDDEDIEVIELSFDDALTMIADGSIKDGKTVILLQYLQLHLLNNNRNILHCSL